MKLFNVIRRDDAERIFATCSSMDVAQEAKQKLDECMGYNKDDSPYKIVENDLELNTVTLDGRDVIVGDQIHELMSEIVKQKLQTAHRKMLHGYPHLRDTDLGIPEITKRITNKVCHNTLAEDDLKDTILDALPENDFSISCRIRYSGNIENMKKTPTGSFVFGFRNSVPIEIHFTHVDIQPTEDPCIFSYVFSSPGYLGSRLMNLEAVKNIKSIERIGLSNFSDDGLVEEIMDPVFLYNNADGTTCNVEIKCMQGWCPKPEHPLEAVRAILMGHNDEPDGAILAKILDSEFNCFVNYADLMSALYQDMNKEERKILDTAMCGAAVSMAYSYRKSSGRYVDMRNLESRKFASENLAWFHNRLKKLIGFTPSVDHDVLDRTGNYRHALNNYLDFKEHNCSWLPGFIGQWGDVHPTLQQAIFGGYAKGVLLNQFPNAGLTQDNQSEDFRFPFI